MKNLFFKRIASAFVSACLLVSSSAVFADTKELFALRSNSSHKSGQQETVRVIVELDDAPLLSYGAKIGTYSSVSDFFASNEAKGIEQKLEQNRKAVKKALVQSGMDFTVKCEYSAVMNGFAVEAEMADLEAIRETAGVKDAFVAEFYSLPEPVKVSSNGGISAIGADIVGEELGFTGKSSAVAILDTGLDTAHPAFSSVNRGY